MFKSRPAYARALFLAAVAMSLIAFTACGGDDAGGDDPTATTGAGEPTSTPSGGLGGVFDNACEVIELAANIPGAMIDAEASDDPPSDTADEIADYFSSVISDALGGAAAGCYLEVTENDEYGLYVGFTLDEAAPTNAVDLIKAELVDRGVADGDVETFTTNTGGIAFSAVNVTNVEALGEHAGSDTAIFVSGQSVGLIVDGSGSGDGPGEEPTTVSTPSESSLDPTVAPSGLSAEADGALRSELQDALGVNLNLTTEFSTTSGGMSTASLTYQATSGVSGNVIEAMSSVATGLGGEVSITSSSGGVSVVYFTGLEIGERVTDGWFSLENGMLTVILSFTQ